MSWIYDTPEGVAAYLAATEGQDGRRLVQLLQDHLADGARVLEIGSGPGRDLKLLAVRWRVVGSDRSMAFVEHLRGRLTASATTCGVERVEQLDAVELEPSGDSDWTPGVLDAIYSNKVLHHLTDGELAQSLRAQRRVLAKGGLLAHSFWLEGSIGTTGGREHDEVLFLPRSVDRVTAMLDAAGFRVIEVLKYGDLGAIDSFGVVARR